MKILLAVDGSEYSQRAARAVAARPWPEGASVRVLHVLPQQMLARAGGHQPPAMAMGEASPRWPLAMMDAEREILEHVSTVTDALVKELKEQGLEADAKQRYGDPRSEIIDEAAEWQADLIVVGSHGYTGLKRLLLGSVAHSVVSHAPCSVEVVR